VVSTECYSSSSHLRTVSFSCHHLIMSEWTVDGVYLYSVAKHSAKDSKALFVILIFESALQDTNISPSTFTYRYWTLRVPVRSLRIVIYPMLSYKVRSRCTGGIILSTQRVSLRCAYITHRTFPHLFYFFHWQLTPNHGDTRASKPTEGILYSSHSLPIIHRLFSSI